MNIVFICGIPGLTLEKSSFKYAQATIYNQINDVEVFGDFDYRRFIGEWEVANLSKSAIAFFSKNITDKVEAEENIPWHVHKEAQLFMGAVRAIRRPLWIIRDNSVSIGKTYVKVSGGNVNTHYYCYPAQEIFTTNRGNFENTVFNEDELNHTKKINHKLQPISFYDKAKIAQPKDAIGDDSNENLYMVKLPEIAPDINDNRIYRAVEFIESAREAKYLPAKIALYMSVLEGLFSNDPSEVAHKVCERVAFYLGGDNVKRLEIFDSLKLAYNIRSRYVHSANFDKKQISKSYQSDISAKVDEIIRTVIRKIIFDDRDTFLQADNEMDKFFKGLIFPIK